MISVLRYFGYCRASDSGSSPPGHLKPKLPELSFPERKLLSSNPLKRKPLKRKLSPLSFRSLNIRPLKLRPLKLSSLALAAALATACGGGGGSSGGGGPIDTTRPSVQIQDVPNRHDGRTAFTLGIRFSESVSGFERGDLGVSGAAVTAFSGSGASYTATLTPNTPPVNIAFEVPANVARDAAGNGNTAAARQTVPYVAPDTTPPRVSINAPTRHNGRPFEVTFAFSETVRGFEAGDIRITGARITTFPSQTSLVLYTATLTPNNPPGPILIEVPANVAQDAAGNGNTAAARQRVAYLPPPPPGKARISGRLTFDRVPITNRVLDYDNIRQEPIRGVWVDAVDASGTVLERTRSDASGRYRLDVTANTEVRIRVRAHMQQTQAGEPRWDVKVTDNTNGNALYVAQGDLASSGTGASTRNLNARSGWVPSGSGGSYANAREAAPFAILSFTYDALQKFAAVDPDINLPALEYRWSIRNRSTSEKNLADGALGCCSFYMSVFVGGVQTVSNRNSLIYLLGRENENTDEYDQSVVIHEFAHHVQAAMSRSDSPGGPHTSDARLDMRVAFNEGFANALAAMIADDPADRDSFGPGQASVGVLNIETNPVNPTGDPNRIGWYHRDSVSAILYDLYDGANAADNDSLSLGLAPIYNTLTSNGFKNNRYYISIYLFANQLLQHVPAANRATTQTSLNALLSRHNIFGRGDNGSGETNNGGLPASARVLPVHKSLSTRNSPITLCSVEDKGPEKYNYNRLGNRAFVEVSFAESGAHTLTMTTAAGSRAANPQFEWWPRYPGVNQWRSTSQWTSTPRSATLTGNFRAGVPLVLEAFDEQNTDSVTNNDGDSCFTFSVVKN